MLVGLTACWLLHASERVGSATLSHPMSFVAAGQLYVEGLGALCCAAAHHARKHDRGAGSHRRRCRSCNGSSSSGCRKPRSGRWHGINQHCSTCRCVCKHCWRRYSMSKAANCAGWQGAKSRRTAHQRRSGLVKCSSRRQSCFHRPRTCRQQHCGGSNTRTATCNHRRRCYWDSSQQHKQGCVVAAACRQRVAAK